MRAPKNIDERALKGKYQELVKWAVEFYDNDYLFVELSRADRKRIDQNLRAILMELNVDFDGK